MIKAVTIKSCKIFKSCHCDLIPPKRPLPLRPETPASNGASLSKPTIENSPTLPPESYIMVERSFFTTKIIFSLNISRRIYFIVLYLISEPVIFISSILYSGVFSVFSIPFLRCIMLFYF